MLDDSLPKVLPSLMRLRVSIRGRLCGEDIGSTERRAILFGDKWPAHEFWIGEELEERSFFGDEGVAGIGVDTMEKVGLFVVVGGKDYVEDDALEDLAASLISLIT